MHEIGGQPDEIASSVVAIRLPRQQSLVAKALQQPARTNDPFAEVGKAQVAVDVSSVIRASKDSFRIAWSERRYQDGSLVERSRWSAIVTVAIRPPRTPDALRRNPIGLFVNAINWSKELSQ